MSLASRVKVPIDSAELTGQSKPLSHHLEDRLVTETIPIYLLTYYLQIGTHRN